MAHVYNGKNAICDDDIMKKDFKNVLCIEQCRK